MSTKFYKNEKFQKVFYPVLYFLLLIFLVCGACLAFSKFYYEEIYVSGPSMNPTLIGNNGPNHRSHYGKADKSRRVINNLNRFDVVITYFPDSWTTFDNDVYKIKRVWGFPGETISIKDGNTDQLVFTVIQNDKEICKYTASIKTEKVNIDGSESYWRLASFDVGKKSFKVRVDAEKRLFTKTLANDEYFIMDNIIPLIKTLKKAAKNSFEEKKNTLLIYKERIRKMKVN